MAPAMEPAVSSAAPVAPPAPVVVLPSSAIEWTNQFSEVWLPLDALCETLGIEMAAPPAAGNGPVELRTPHGPLLFYPGQAIARWNHIDLWLGFGLRRLQGIWRLHVLDAQKNLEPLLRPDPAPCRSPRTIVIDPGHGGADPGASNTVTGQWEKDYTLDWARRLEPLLAAQGWIVVLSRDEDVDCPLADRVKLNGDAPPDLFLSLHFNSAKGDPRSSGIETYCLTPTGMPSHVARENSDNLAAVFPNNAFDADNLRYAARLHECLVRATGALDRGVRRARFMGVLRGQTQPAVLVEGGYLSNPDEARKIADPDYRQKLAKAVAEALDLRPFAQ